MMQRNNDIEKKIAEAFPDLKAHHPDCSSITDEELTECIFATWPKDNLETVINYSFSNAPYWSHLLLLYTARNFIPEQISGELADRFKDTIRYALNEWTKASNNLLQFKEVDSRFHPFQSGISFSLAPTQYFYKESMTAFTYTLLNNDGDIHQALIFLPDSPEYWSALYNNAWAWRTWFHEIGHALGFLHLHLNDAIQEKLQNIPDGLFCSVMPYNEEIISPTNECEQHCNPSYAIIPGPLDKRLVELAYLYGQKYISKSLLEDNYFWTAMDLGFVGILSGAMHESIYIFLKDLAIHKEQPSLSKNVALLAADTTLLGIIAFCGLPAYMIATYVAFSLLGYTPDRYKNKFPQLVQRLLAGNMNVNVLNILFVFSKGTTLNPLMMSLVSNLLGIVLGNVFLAKFAKIPLYFTNKILQEITSCCTQEHKYEPINEIVVENLINNDIELDVCNDPHYQMDEPRNSPVIQDAVRISQYSSSLFAPRASFCNRISNWLGISNRP